MRLTIDGTTFDYLERGSGPAVVLLHPFGLRKEIWSAQFDALAEHARVVALDLRGMGASEAPPGPYLMESLAGDVAGIMDALRIERAIVVGHSYSVAVAYEIFRMYAERVSGLVLVCGRAAAPTPEAAHVLEERADVLDRENDARTMIERASGLLGESTRREHPEVLGRVEALLARSSPRGAAATLRGMAMRAGADDLLEDVTIPYLAIAGDEDDIVAPQAILADVARVSNGMHVTLPRCGHLPQLEVPEAMRDALVPFVSNAR